MPLTLKIALALVLAPAAIALFFYAFTRGTLLLRGLRPGSRSPSSHVYALYSQMWLIRLVDFQPVIAAILLFQYSRLVTLIADELRGMALQGRDILITSCAFGNVMPRVVAAAADAGVRRVKVVDIIANELEHATDKLQPHRDRLDCSLGDATAMALPSGSVAANVIFFLLHELEPEMKRKAVAEAARVLEPGGKLLLAEFHKPDAGLLRALSWLYFKTFEPFGLALWDVQDPVAQLNAIPGISCTRKTLLWGNFQVIVATRVA